MKKYGIEQRPLPSHRHNKNVIESKHRVIRDVFLRLKSACGNDATVSVSTLVKQAIRITNDLYDNDGASAHELAKGYTRPVQNSFVPSSLPKEILEAHENLKAKKKPTLILRSKATSDESFKPGNIVQVFIKKGNEKRGKSSGDKVVLEYDHDSRIVIVPGSGGRRIRAAVEDVRAALPGDCSFKDSPRVY